MKSNVEDFMKLKKLTEAEFTRQVIALAKLHGWLVAHFRPARTAKGWRTPCQGDAKGFPDLVMLRHERIIVAELKVGRGILTLSQDRWLLAFRRVGIEVYQWYPEDWELIEKVLE
jgi:hypothetical protein